MNEKLIQVGAVELERMDCLRTRKKRIIMLKKFKEFTKDSEFTEEDALRLGRELNKKLAKRYLR